MDELEDNRPDPTGLYTPEELALVRSVQRSKVWRLITDALVRRREDLYGASPPLDARNYALALAHNKGSLDEVQWLLQHGPYLVVYYQRFMRDQERAKSQASRTGESGDDYLDGGPFDGGNVNG